MDYDEFAARIRTAPRPVLETVARHLSDGARALDSASRDLEIAIYTLRADEPPWRAELHDRAEALDGIVKMINAECRNRGRPLVPEGL